LGMILLIGPESRLVSQPAARKRSMVTPGFGGL
jgi:hypothetical protein